MKRNEDGINLVRCIGLLFVFGFHYFLYNGYHYQNQTGAAMLFANASRALFIGCNGLYMMLTGYLKSDKPLNRHYYQCILSVITCYVLAAAISIPIRHFYLGDVQTFSVWLNRFLGFNGVYYGWYLRMYIGLILISPVINLAITKMEDKKTLFFVTVSLVAATSFSAATPYQVFPSYWEAAYPLSYYLLGAVIKKIQPKVKAVPLILCILVMAFGTGSATLLSTDGVLKEALTWEFGVVWIMIISTSIFLLFYRVNLPVKLSKAVRFIANGAFPAYMLSHLTDAWIYRLVPAWREPRFYIIGFVLLTIPSYAFMVTVGNGVQRVCDMLILHGKRLLHVTRKGRRC